MPSFTFTSPEGKQYTVQGPDGATKEQAFQMLQAQLSGAKPEPSMLDSVQQGAGDAAAGLVRGAGSIGATLLAPVDMAKDALAGKGLSLESNRERRAKMDAGLRSMGADTDSLMFKGGKLVSEVAGTAGAGGLVANGARALAPSLIAASPRLAQLVSAVESSGFATGAQPATTFAGKAADLGIRTVGGAINGGATAGLINPEDAGSGAVIGGALPGAVKVAGAAGNVLRSKVEGASKKLMQSAIKPTIAQLRTGDADTAVQTLLEYGISPTKAGVNKLRLIIDDLNGQIAAKIGGSSATIDKQMVVNRLQDVEKQFANQVAPTADLAAIRGVADDFLAHPSYPGASIPVQAAQELKQGTYRTLAKKYGQMGGAETEAQKGLARGLKEEIAQAVPGVEALNATESRLLKTLGVAERRALMELNKNPMGLAALAGNPLGWAAFMADRSAAFKALAARMLNRTAEAGAPAALMLERGAANPLLRNSAIAIGAGE